MLLTYVQKQDYEFYLFIKEEYYNLCRSSVVIFIQLYFGSHYVYKLMSVSHLISHFFNFVPRGHSATYAILKSERLHEPIKN